MSRTECSPRLMTKSRFNSYEAIAASSSSAPELSPPGHSES
jgi:hypothetical protein